MKKVWDDKVFKVNFLWIDKINQVFEKDIVSEEIFERVVYYKRIVVVQNRIFDSETNFKVV